MTTDEPTKIWYYRRKPAARFRQCGNVWELVEIKQPLPLEALTEMTEEMNRKLATQIVEPKG